MNQIQQLLTENIGLWTGADTAKKSGRGRASGSAGTVYGIKKLRELILELAVRGKLVPQDASDESASELLKRMHVEKEKLIVLGEIKNNKSLPVISEKEIPYTLPSNWEWLRLPDSYYPIPVSGNQLLSSDIKATGNFPVVDQGQRFVAGYTDDENLLIRIPGPVIVFGDHTTARKFIDFDFVAGADGVKILRPISINEKFFWLQLVSLKLEGRGYARHYKVLNECFFAVPPIDEQTRIVAKVDELMALCDQLEAGHTDAADAHEKLVTHLLAPLTASQDSADFSAGWQCIAAHFDILFTTETSIDALKQALLQLAVMGKLLPQDPGDEPASALLEHIQAEKAKLVLEGKIKKDKLLAAISDDEKPFDLPQGWEWVRLDQLSHVGTGATPLRTKPEYFDPPAINWVTSGETSSSHIFKTEQYVSSLAIEETNLTVYPSGTLIVAMYGQGKTRGQITELMIDACTNQACAAISLFNREIHHRKYVKLFFVKIYDEIRELAAGGAQPNLNLSKIKETLLSLPPISEQARIVAKVDELMALCDRMKTRIADASALQRKLADVMVAQAVA